MTAQPHRRLAAVALLPVLLLAGCAVMRIDVDVYKGPLADHETVQTERLGAMTIGAKPILVQLRDQLEWEDRKERACVRSGKAVVNQSGETVCNLGKLPKPPAPQNTATRPSAASTQTGQATATSTQTAQATAAATTAGQGAVGSGAAGQTTTVQGQTGQTSTAAAPAASAPANPPATKSGKTKAGATSEPLRYAKSAMYTYRFRDEQAGRVNAILSLYDDLELVWQVDGFLDGLETATSGHIAARARFAPNPAQDAVTWGRAVAALTGLTDGEQQVLLETRDRWQPWKCEKRFEEIDKDQRITNKRRLALLLEYKRFLDPTAAGLDWRRNDCLLLAAARVDRPLVPAVPQGEVTVGEGDQSEAAPKTSRPKERQTEPKTSESDGAKAAAKLVTDFSANGTFMALASSDPPSFLADGLSAAAGKEAGDILERRTRELAGAFLDMRQSFRDAWLLTLQLLTRLNSDDFYLQQIGSGQRTTVNRELAQLAAILTSPRELALALSLEASPNDLTKLADLHDQLATLAPGLWDVRQPANAYRKWTENDKARMQQGDDAIRMALEKRPVAVAQALLIADNTYREATPEAVQKALGQEDAISAETCAKSGRFVCKRVSLESRAFGLVRAADRIGEVREQLIRQAVQTGVTARNLRNESILSRGRHWKGIERLIEESIAQTSSSEPCEGGDKCREHRIAEANRLLWDALVRFAQKVLVIANNETLLTNEKRDEDSEGNVPINRYTLVLQAVGNSIVVQADELRTRESHRQHATAENRIAAEQRARAAAFGGDAQQTLDKLLKDLNADAGNAANAVKTAKADQTAAATQVKTAGDAVTKAQTGEEAACSAVSGKQTALDTVAGNAAGIVAAYRTVAGDPADFDAHQKLKSTETGAAFTDDSQKLDATLAKLTGTPTVNAVREEMLKWTNSQSFPDLASAPRQQRLTAVTAYLTAPPDQLIASTTQLAPEEAIRQAKAIIAGHYATAKSAVVTSRAALVTEKTKCNNAGTALANAKQAKQTADAAKSTTDNAVKTAEAQQTKASDAAKAVAALKGDVARQADADGIGNDPAAVQRRLQAKVAADLAAARDKKKQADAGTDQTAKDEAKAEVERLERVQAVLAARPAPLGLAALASADGADPESQVEVLDEVIALLRYLEIDAIQQGGTKGQAEQVRAALKTAYDHRSGMVYIRPASAYLRSSYPSTSLQGDPRNVWENMLAEHAKRSIPGLGTGSEDAKQRAEIVAEIDKQFWQNINSVRVGGGGNTNYAIAKDDVGNWYVKSYSADPEVIIRSAQRLGMFALGGSMDINLLRQLELQDRVDDSTTTEAQRQRAQSELDKLRKKDGSPADTSTLGRVFDRYASAHVEQTRKDYRGLRDALADEALTTEIKREWADILSVTDGDTGPNATALASLSTDLDAAASELPTVAGTSPQLPALKEEPSDSGAKDTRAQLDDALETGQRIARALTDVQRFQTLATRAVYRNGDLDAVEDTAGTRKKLEAAVVKIVRPVVTNTGETRQEALRQLETSIGFIGEASATE